jgi:hypothetical protein
LFKTRSCCGEAKMAVVKPIVYGNSSSQLPKVQPGGRTHSWTLYVNSATGEVRWAFCIFSNRSVRPKLAQALTALARISRPSSRMSLSGYTKASPTPSVVRAVRWSASSQTHDSRAPVVEKPPYQISESGWGEFEVIVLHACSCVESVSCGSCSPILTRRWASR